MNIATTAKVLQWSMDSQNVYTQQSSLGSEGVKEGSSEPAMHAYNLENIIFQVKKEQ